MLEHVSNYKRTYDYTRLFPSHHHKLNVLPTDSAVPDVIGTIPTNSTTTKSPKHTKCLRHYVHPRPEEVSAVQKFEKKIRMICILASPESIKQKEAKIMFLDCLYQNWKFLPAYSALKSCMSSIISENKRTQIIAL